MWLNFFVVTPLSTPLSDIFYPTFQVRGQETTDAEDSAVDVTFVFKDTISKQVSTLDELNL